MALILMMLIYIHQKDYFIQLINSLLYWDLLLFISAFYTLLKNDCKYYLSFLIKLIAALMLSTKTAFFAITFSILSIFVYALIEYVFTRKKY